MKYLDKNLKLISAWTKPQSYFNSIEEGVGSIFARVIYLLPVANDGSTKRRKNNSF